MKNRLWMIVAMIMALTLVLAACGAPAETPAPAAPAPAATQPPAPEPDPVATEAPAEEAEEAEEAAEEPMVEEGTVLTRCEPGAPSITIWADDTRAPILASLGAEFESEFGVCVAVTEKGFGDIRDDFKVAGPVGEGPDIIIGAHDWLGELVINGLLAEVELGDNADLFLEGAVTAFTYDGALYGMPYATENIAFVYNPELVETVPTTWEEVQALAAELEADGLVRNGYIIQTNDPYHFFPIQTAFGGYVFGLTADGYDPSDVGIDSEGTLAAAAWLDGMVEAGHIPAGGVNYDTMHAAFESGDAAMIITGPWALGRIRESGIPYAVAAIPGQAQAAQPFLGVQGFMVSAFSSDALLAQTFLQEKVATVEAMSAIFEADPRPSAFIPVRDMIEDEDLLGFAAAGAEGLPMPAIPEMSAVWSSWGSAMELVITQAVDSETAFVEAADQIRNAIAGNQ